MPTRSSKSKTAADAEADAKQAPPPILNPNDDNPPQLFVLPKDASIKSRFYTLPNPATSRSSRYFYCPEHGLYEFTKASSLPTSPGSFLIACNEDDTDKPLFANEASDEPIDTSSNPIAGGYMLEDADIFVATPFDPLFFLIPTLDPLTFPSKGTFRQEDDFLEKLAPDSKHMQSLVQRREFKDNILGRLRSISDVQELQDETLYRPNAELLFNEILSKASRAVYPNSWPASLEEHEVRRATDIPPLPSLRSEHSTTQSESFDDTNLASGDNDVPVIKEDSQQSVVDVLDESSVEKVKPLFRLHSAIHFMLQSYFPRSPVWIDFITNQIESSRKIDFKLMIEHQALVKKRKDDLQALRSLSDNISRKRSGPDDDEAAEARAEKKRKKEEEEKRKKAESRAMKDLKKTDTSGMKKLSSFFTKAAPKAKT